MKECWRVKDKAKYYILKDRSGKREVVFTCQYGHLTTLGVCYGMCIHNGRCVMAREAIKQKEVKDELR